MGLPTEKCDEIREIVKEIRGLAMIRVQILDFNKESELVFTATFEMVRAINSTYDCGNYTLEVNRKVVFNGFVSNDHELIIKNI